MRISFFSNYFNIHQLPLALEFNAMEGVDYTFVSLLATEGAVGRASLDDAYPFVLKEYKGAEHASLAMRHALTDDIVVFGDMAGKEKYVRGRAKAGKPFFRYAERVLKRGDLWRFAPPKVYRTWDRFTRYKNTGMLVLCSSAYTARDLALFGFPVDKCLRWGYFPSAQVESPGGDVNSPLPRYKAMCSAQRLIPWKRVELQLHALQRVIKKGFDVSLTIAGDGPQRADLEALAGELGVLDHVFFVGELSHSDVLTLMRECGIFLATSDRHEGWGATVNEAMSMACCVVASEEMGSVPYLIKDGDNGYSYGGNDADALAGKIVRALSNPQCSAGLGAQAKTDIEGTWSAREAARRFAELAEALMTGTTPAPEAARLWGDGPLSSAGEHSNA